MAISNELIRSFSRTRRDGISALASQILRLCIYEVRTGIPVEAVKAEVRRALGFDLDISSALDDDAGLRDAEGLDRKALQLSYPTWFFERLVPDLGLESTLLLADAMNARAPLCVRTNTSKISRDDLIGRLAEEGVSSTPTLLSTTGLSFETRVNAFALSAFRDGLFEVMDEGSQLVAEAVAPPPRGWVLDACAGAGGKTLALSASLGGQGRILALDSNGKKLEELRRRARRAGLSNLTAREVKGQVMPPDAKVEAWDRVLVDAPCSGLGTLRRNPEARWRLTSQVVERFPAEQLGLMVTYAPFVAKGGRLIYATCSVLREENDGVVERFLKERPDFVVMPMKDIWGKLRATQLGDGTFLRLYPHVHNTDGFFAAVLRRVNA
jgi:16S rRNA (cytosine967-C5)-methyltransferase